MGRLLDEEPGNGPMDRLIQQQIEADVPDFGAIIGFAVGHVHRPGANGKGADIAIAPPGTRVGLVFPAAGDQAQAGVRRLHGRRLLQERDERVRLELTSTSRSSGSRRCGCSATATGRGAVNQIQVKARKGVDLDKLAVAIQTGARPAPARRAFKVSTWEQKQGPLLAAVAVEQSILNILLFFIIAVAGSASWRSSR